MNQTLWRFTELLAHTLSPAECEAVLGDLAESGLPAKRALRGVIGLVLRRSARRIGLPLVIIPFGLLLSILARSTADGAAIYLWFWGSNLDLHLLTNAGFWNGVAGSAPYLVLACATVVLWSWSMATLAVCLSRETALCLCGVVAICAFFGPPQVIDSVFSLSRGRDFAANAAVFRSPFYRIVFPCLVQFVLVLLPALRAIRNPRMENAS